MPDELEEKIIKFLAEHDVATIAVSDGKNPSAHTMYYASHGLHVYFMTDPQSKKVHILQANPQISLTVDHLSDGWRGVKGIQAFGRVNIVRTPDAPRIEELFMDRLTHLKEMGGIPKYHVFIEAIPEKIYFLDYSGGKVVREVFFAEEKRSILNW